MNFPRDLEDWVIVLIIGGTLFSVVRGLLKGLELLGFVGGIG